MFTFLAGWRLYALLGIGLVIVALAGTVYVQRLEHQADVAKLDAAKQTIDQFSNALKQSEADKARLIALQSELDAQIKVRDQRAKELEVAKRKLADELDSIKKTLPVPDQSCMDRDLPDAVLGLLRGGPATGDKDGSPQGSGKPAQSVS